MISVRRVVLILLMATGAAAQPDTLAGRVLTAWLDAFNSGDPAKMRAFQETYRRDPPPGSLVGLRHSTGGFTLLRVEKSEPGTLVALLQEKHSDTVARFDLTVSGDPPKIDTAHLEAVDRPAELALPRLSESAALAALEARLDELAADDLFSGVVLVARDGEVLLGEARGKADRERGAPVTSDTRFRIGSMNKMFTATAILRLAAAGTIALDDPIGKHLPGYPNAEVASSVTVRHLLGHRGGTGDIFGPQFQEHRLTLRDHADYLKLYGSRGLLHAPGAEFRYSNYGFVLLGALIEQVSGLSYDDHVRRHVFEPAGMTATGAQPESDAVPNRSRGYMRNDEGWTSNADTLPWRGTAAGGGYSTARDVLRFARALESGTLVPRALLDEATTRHHVGGPGRGYGYGFSVLGEGDLRSYGHAGGAPGMNGELRIYPKLGYVLVALSNLDPPAASRVVDFFALRMPVHAGRSTGAP